jgi:hypothetical protein
MHQQRGIYSGAPSLLFPGATSSPACLVPSLLELSSGGTAPSETIKSKSRHRLGALLSLRQTADRSGGVQSLGARRTQKQ